MRLGRILSITLITIITAGGASCIGDARRSAPPPRQKKKTEGYQAVAVDSVIPQADKNQRYTHLTEDDFRRVAKELQVEIAAIKAVVEVEAGKAMKGFWAPGVPVVNYDKSMWSHCKRLVKKNDRLSASATIPKGLTTEASRRAWQRLVAAQKKNIEQANLSTFWGMFQIGGFNYKLCGCESIGQFVNLMSYSELEQLELFAALIVNCNMVQCLRQKNWAAFARKYNGASYARRGYHTRMANAYKKYASQ